MTKNIGESILAKLKNVSKETNISMQALLRRYAQERLLYRLALSDEVENFCVKGGVLVSAYVGSRLLRPSEDIDFNGFMEDGTVEGVVAVVEKIVRDIKVDDGIEFYLDTLKVKAVREGKNHGGKISMNAKVGTALVDLRVDVGFGNVITPGVRRIVMPSLLNSVPSAEVLAYPLETVVAEKTAIFLEYGLVNTRLKDYFDLVMIARTNELNGPDLALAISNTFKKREISIPTSRVDGLSAEFIEDNDQDWKGFLKKIDYRDKLPLPTVISEIASFIEPVFAVLAKGEEFTCDWHPDSGWLPSPVSTPGI